MEKGWGQSATTEEDARDETGFVADVDGVVSPVDANGDAVESEPPVKTLDDYLAEKAAAKKPSLALPVQRQANEGADASKWKNTVAIQRPPVEEEMFFKPTAAGKKDKAVAAQQQKSTKSNKTVAIEVKFMDEPAPRFERSERGGSRGGARGGASRGGASRGGASRGGASRGQGSTRGGPTPNVSDKSAFPTLAK